MKNIGYIYKITNKINGKAYVGQTIRTIEERWEEHCRPNSQCEILSNAIQKYGRENFTIERLYKTRNLHLLNKKEEFFIRKERCQTPNGYNVLLGGYQHRQSSLSEDHKKKIALAHLGMKLSEKTKQKISESKKGSIPWNKGKRLSPSHIEKSANARRGKPMSEETKRKISETMKRIRACQNSASRSS